MRQIKNIVIHCTDSPDDLDIGRKEIDKWHKDRGWSGIGYHFVVRRSGVIEVGRLLDVTGAHVRGHNRGSIGICWVGRDRPTVKQYKSLLELATALTRLYKLPWDTVFGHTELDPMKTCPNLDMNRFRGEILFTGAIRDEVFNAISLAGGPEDNPEEREPDTIDD